jgi:hypothetical protein
VLDAVDAGGDQLGDRLLAEAVCGDPGAELVGPGDRSRSRSIQSPTSLTQPSPRAAWVSTSATRSAGSISTP